MPVKLSEIVDTINLNTTVYGVLRTLRVLFSDPCFCLQSLETLSPFIEKIRRNPSSATALNDFAHVLERMDASMYDEFMHQPENKDIIELYSKTDRSTTEYRTKLVNEAIISGRKFIDEFEKETGINLADNAKESLKIYNLGKRLVYNSGNYIQNVLKLKHPEKTEEELQKYYKDKVLRNFERHHYEPMYKKSTEVLQKFIHFLKEKSDISEAQAEEWYTKHVEISPALISMAEQAGCPGGIKEYVKGLYRISNGLGFEDLNISTKPLDAYTMGHSTKEDGKLKIVLDEQKFYLETLTHEFGHCIDFCSSNNSIIIHQFLKNRSEDGALHTIPIFRDAEGYLDKFYTAYAGRVYSSNETECVSTGFEQLALTNYDSLITLKYGYKYQAYDKDHLAMTIGLSQNAKNIGESSRDAGEVVGVNTARAMMWGKSVKEAISEKTYEQMLKGEYSCGKFKIRDFSSDSPKLIIGIAFGRSVHYKHLQWVKEYKQIPSIAYVLWGYLYEKFPFGIIYKKPMDIVQRMPRSAQNVYIPFWYSGGMKLPKMR